MGSQVWLLLLRGGRLDTSKHGRFTVNASLRWPMPAPDGQGRFWFGWFRGVSAEQLRNRQKLRPRQALINVLLNPVLATQRDRCYPPGRFCQL